MNLQKAFLDLRALGEVKGDGMGIEGNVRN